MDIFIKKNKNVWLHAKQILDALKKDNLITFDEWYFAILFVRKNLNLPICENVLFQSKK